MCSRSTRLGGTAFKDYRRQFSSSSSSFNCRADVLPGRWAAFGNLHTTSLIICNYIWALTTFDRQLILSQRHRIDSLSFSNCERSANSNIHFFASFNCSWATRKTLGWFVRIIDVIVICNSISCNSISSTLACVTIGTKDVP